jgi:hypothetical protein
MQYSVISSTPTHYQILVPANENHTYFVATWVPRSSFRLASAFQPGNFFSYKVEVVPEIDAEMLGQLRLE